MIRLSIAERDYLLANGAKYHRDIHATAKGNNTYATENDRVLGLLTQMYGKEYKVKR